VTYKADKDECTNLWNLLATGSQYWKLFCSNHLFNGVLSNQQQQMTQRGTFHPYWIARSAFQAKRISNRRYWCIGLMPWFQALHRVRMRWVCSRGLAFARALSGYSCIKHLRQLQQAALWTKLANTNIAWLMDARMEEIYSASFAIKRGELSSLLGEKKCVLLNIFSSTKIQERLVWCSSGLAG